VVVVDTSVWIAFFRGRDSALATAFERLLDRDQVLVPAPVRIEILGGARHTDLTRLRRVLAALPVVEPGPATWSRIDGWIDACVAAGQHFGVGDLLVAAIAAERAAPVWSLDGDFERLERLGFVRTHRAE